MGDNKHGQLGIKTKENAPVPTKIQAVNILITKIILFIKLLLNLHKIYLFYIRDINIDNHNMTKGVTYYNIPFEYAYLHNLNRRIIMINIIL